MNQNDAWDDRLTVLDYHVVQMSDYAFLDVFSSALSTMHKRTLLLAAREA